MKETKQPLRRLSLQQTNRPIETLRFWSESGDLLIDPPYQRGDVWGLKRRRNLIRSILLGIPIPSIIINNRESAEWVNDQSIAVIDGRQRIQSVLGFLNSRFAVPGEWFGLDDMVRFAELPIVDQRRMRNKPLAFSEGSLKTLEDEREVFELVNFGGVPQGETDLLCDVLEVSGEA
ncbi:DUF262 domain-containing protein [Rosistilla oblonga]|uniref:DUF262 domain-containing protein n=1 Tax=Rosistilla oblonga TaxID=2527990 RepID=UPI003A973AE8